MKHERRKQYRSYLEFFARTFQVRAPYKILCDGNFIHHFVTHSLGDKVSDLRRLIATVLETEDFTLLVVDSAIKELEELGEEASLRLAKQLERQRVGRDLAESQRFSPPQAITKLVGQRNFKKFMVATLDEDLASTLRNVPGVPLLFMRRVMILLEAPSDASRAFWKKQEDEKLKVPKGERKRIVEMVRAAKSTDASESSPKKRPLDGVASSGRKKRQRHKEKACVTEIKTT